LALDWERIDLATGKMDKIDRVTSAGALPMFIALRVPTIAFLFATALIHSADEKPKDIPVEAKPAGPILETYPTHAVFEIV
jgi:hypothetical protein